MFDEKKLRRVDEWDLQSTLLYISEYHPQGLSVELKKNATNFLKKNKDGLVRVKDKKGTDRLIPYCYAVCNDLKDEDLTDFPTEEDKKNWDASEDKKKEEEKSKEKWTPDLDDKKGVKKGIGTWITKARDEYKKRFRDYPLKALRDSIGIFAYVYSDKILVAKKYVYGNIVSAHKKAVERAYQQKKDFVMYIVESNSFYKFDTEKIIQKGRLNKRNGIEMLNFNITLGMNIEKKFYPSDIEEKDGTTQVTLA